MTKPIKGAPALSFQSVHKFRRFVFNNLERKNTARYHYPRIMLDQPYFVWPATGKATLHLSMLANTTQYVSPLLALLNQLRSEGHEIAAAFDEAVAMRAALQQANQVLDDISTLALKARVGSVE